MKNVSRAILLVCLILLVAVSGCKQEAEPGTDSDEGKTTSAKSEKKTKGKKDKPPKLIAVPDGVVSRIMKPFEAVTLTSAQEKEVDTLIRSNGNEFRRIRRERNALISKELRDKRLAARKKARDAGADAAAAEKAAMGDEIYAKAEKLDSEENDLVDEIRKSIIGDILTKEQNKVRNEARKAGKS